MHVLAPQSYQCYREQNPSFATARVEHCVSCQVLNLLLCSSVMKMGAFQPSFSCSIPPSVLPPPTAHFCDGNLSLDTQKVTQRPTGGTIGQTDGQPSVRRMHDRQWAPIFAMLMPRIAGLPERQVSKAPYCLEYLPNCVTSSAREQTCSEGERERDWRLR